MVYSIIDLKIQRHVIEYQAEILENERGEQIRASFPDEAGQRAQYGNGVKSHAVYMSVKQLIPCERCAEHFSSQLGIPLSAGSICNFKEEAYQKLEYHEG